MFNLIGNATKFTFKGSIKVNVSFIDDYLVTKVTDSGVGIQQNDLAQLIQFFGKIG